MKLLNFCLEDDMWPRGIEVDDFVYDMHNAFSFGGLKQNIAERKVTLSWQPSGYGESPLPTQGFEIVFSDVTYFEATPRDNEIPDFGEDLCLGGLSLAPADAETAEMLASGVPYIPFIPEGDFHLWFSFRSNQHVRIGSATAEFRVVSD